jgi:ring-1,2-phenylacetyl-CoA epoxidase subunit PaaE
MVDGRTILESAEAAGLALPYSCRAGVCSTCRTKVVAGTIEMERNQALEDWEVEAGFVLCCQARPTSARIELSYDEK